MNEDGAKFECKFGVLTPELEALHQLLLTYDVKEVTMESTSIYWHPIWRILDDIEDLKLVNPYFIKQLPGRKSDVRDAIARKMLIAIWHVLSESKVYTDYKKPATVGNSKYTAYCKDSIFVVALTPSCKLTDALSGLGCQC